MRTSSASAKATSDLPDPPSAPKLRNYLPDSRLFVSTSMPRYQLSLEAENLKRKLLHVPSPYARVQITGGPKEGTVVGQTQTIERTLHPVWTEVFFLETDSSIYMPLKISVFDDRGGASDDELLGEVTFEAIEIYQSAGRTKSEKLRNGVRIFASVEESVQGDAQGSADIHLRGLDIKNIEPGLLGLGRSDPFFEIRKKSADHASGVVRWSPVYRSEHIFNHLNPYWKPFSIGLEELCHCDLDWPIRVTVMDWERNGKHRPIGQIETTPRGLQERLAVRGNADRVNAFDIVHDDQITSMGLICVLKVELHLQE